MLAQIHVWLVAISLAACGGGFYKVDDAKQRAVTTTAALQELGYITATISLQNNKLFTSPLYKDKRNGDLSHFYAYAEFPIQHQEHHKRSRST